MVAFPVGEQVMGASAEAVVSKTLCVRGRSFQVIDHPVIAAGAAEFAGGFEEGTLRFCDAALPHCEQMIDCGA
jgi:hypothetical protein